MNLKQAPNCFLVAYVPMMLLGQDTDGIIESFPSWDEAETYALGIVRELRGQNIEAVPIYVYDRVWESKNEVIFIWVHRRDAITKYTNTCIGSESIYDNQ